eukprot:g69863.t1
MYRSRYTAIPIATEICLQLRRGRYNQIPSGSIYEFEEETTHSLIEQLVLENIKDICDDFLLHPCPIIRDRESEHSSPLSFPSSFSFPSPPSGFTSTFSSPCYRSDPTQEYHNANTYTKLVEVRELQPARHPCLSLSHFSTRRTSELVTVEEIKRFFSPKEVALFFAFSATYPHHPCKFLVLTEEVFKVITPLYLSKKNDIIICQLCNVSSKGKTRVELKQHAKGRSHRKKWRKLGLDGLSNTFGYDPYIYYDVAYGEHRDSDWKFGDED